MTILLEVKDSKADFFMELLKSFPFVKTKKHSPAKAQLIHEIKEAVEEVKLAKQGRIKLQSAKEFLREL